MEKRTVCLLILLFFVLNQKSISQQKSLKQITFRDSTRHGFPDWSPCGKYIFYGSSNQKTCYTMKIPSDGGDAIKLTNYFTQHARCSPDGKYLVFDAELGSLIQLCSSEGGNPIRIVPENIPIVHSGMPCWSPDGKFIAFHSNGVLWTLELANGKFRKIFEMDKKLVAPFDWTPDGNNIIADIRDTINRGESDIWKIPLNENKDKAKQLTFLNGYQVEPNISPDGSMIVFMSWKDRESKMNLFIISSDGGEPVQITFDQGHESEACWSPDGKKIAFSSTRSGYWAIWVMEPDIQFIKGD
ncbi:MAG: TolB family protein [Planctomycetota bacterium]|jgi:TolB protein